MEAFLLHDRVLKFFLWEFSLSHWGPDRIEACFVTFT